MSLAVVALADLASLLGARGSGSSRRVRLGLLAGRAPGRQLAIENLGERGRRLRLRDDVPDVFTADPAEFQLDSPGTRRVELEYRFVPGKRGTYTLGQVDALVSSRLGRWRRAFSWPVQTVVRVYPDVRQIARYTMLARRDRLSVLGVRARAGWGPTTSSSDCAITPKGMIHAISTGARRPAGAS